jgi:hypothetical protein
MLSSQLNQNATIFSRGKPKKLQIKLPKSNEQGQKKDTTIWDVLWSLATTHFTETLQTCSKSG